MLAFLIILHIANLSLTLQAQVGYENERKTMTKDPQARFYVGKRSAYSPVTERILYPIYEKETESRKQKRFSINAIYEGTKWCGKGNIAADYNDLGYHKETDACCRKHDHCQHSIPGYEEKYGLTNNYVYTMSQCECDEEFHSCLKKANTEASNEIGMLFFNKYEIKCIRHDYPIKRCKEYNSTMYRNHKRCSKYELDETKPKKWQIFDAKEF